MVCSLSSLWKYHWQSTRESAREKELKVAHVVGEEDLLVEDIDGELDLMELGPLNPVLEYPRSLKPYFKVARSLQKCIFYGSWSLWKIPKIKIISNLATLKLLEPMKNLWYPNFKKKSIDQKCGHFLSWSLRGCSELASQARGLAWILEPGLLAQQDLQAKINWNSMK